MRKNLGKRYLGPYEVLERRDLLTSLHNVLLPPDVNGDGFTSPRDVLHLVSDLNDFGARELSTASANGYVDVNNDGYLSPSDILTTINFINVVSQYAAASTSSEPTSLGHSSANNTNPAVIRTATGFLAAWTEIRDRSERSAVVQVLDAAAQPVGDPIKISGRSGIADSLPAIAESANGSFTVVWQRHIIGDIENGMDLYGRTFSSGGIPQSEEFLINQHTPGTQVKPSLALSSDGQIGVAWEGVRHEVGTRTPRYGISFRSFSAQGIPSSDEVRLVEGTPGFHQNTSIISTNDGFLVTWDGTSPEQTHDVFVSAVHTDGSLGATRSATFGREGNHHEPDLISLDNGNYLLGWANDEFPRLRTNIHVVEIDSAGNGVSDVQTIASDQHRKLRRPDFTSTGDTVVATWDAEQHFAQFDVHGTSFQLAAIAAMSSSSLAESAPTSQRSAIAARGDSYLAIWQEHDGNRWQLRSELLPIQVTAPPILPEFPDIKIASTDSLVRDIRASDDDTPAAELQYSVSLAPQNAGTVTIEGTALRVVPADGFLGAVDVLVSVTDGTNDTARSFQLTVGAAPEISLTLPPPLENEGQPISIPIEINDADSPISELAINVSVDNEATWELIGTPPAEIRVTPANTSAAPINVTVTVADECFETTADAQIVFTQPPTLIIGDPVRRGEFIAVPITVTDPDSRPEDLMVDVKVDPAQATAIAIGTPPNEIQITPLIDEGPIVVTATAIDESGNTSEPKKFNVVVTPSQQLDPGPTVRFTDGTVRTEVGKQVLLGFELIDVNTPILDLTVSVTTNDPLVKAELDAARENVIVTPPADYVGSVDITLNARDTDSNSTDIAEVIYSTSSTDDSLQILVDNAWTTVGVPIDIPYSLRNADDKDIAVTASIIRGDGTVTVDATRSTLTVTPNDESQTIEVELLASNGNSIGSDVRRSVAVFVRPGLTLAENGQFLNSLSIETRVNNIVPDEDISFSLMSIVDTASTASAFEDLLLVYLKGADGEDLLPKLGQSKPIMTVFGNAVDLAPGLVTYDGDRVVVETSEIDLNDARLEFQLLNMDDDEGTRFLIGPVNSATFDGQLIPDLLQNAMDPGDELDFTTLREAEQVDFDFSDFSYDANRNAFGASVKIRNNGRALSSEAVIAFRDLPAGATITNASGTTIDGIPYVNVSEAISSGGLESNGETNPIRVNLSNQELARLTVKAGLFVGTANKAPEIAEVPTISVFVGQTALISLGVDDADGDQVTLQVIPNPKAPLVLFSDNVLTISPVPGDEGNHLIEIVASDGVNTTTRTIDLQVETDLDTSTRLTGMVLDTDGAPLVGVPISIDGLSDTTDADGKFAFSTPATITPGSNLFVQASRAGNYPDITETVELLLGRDLFQNTANEISRPIYIPELDDSQMISATNGGTFLVSDGSLKGTSLFVPADSLQSRNGDELPNEIPISITEVDRNLTPASLPSSLNPDIVVTIQNGNLTFEDPALLTLPNRAGYPENTEMDLWSINPTTGEFEVVGRGMVNSAGMIETIDGGIRNSSWHFFSSMVNAAINLAQHALYGSQGCPGCKTTKRASSDVQLFTGELLETHTFPTHQLLGSTRGVSLTYDSLRADPRHILHLGQFDSSTRDNELLSAKLTIRQGDDLEYGVPGAERGAFGLSGGQHFWAIPEGGGNIDAALQVDMSQFASGLYQYEYATGIVQFEDNTVSGTTVKQSADLVHINGQDSEFGNGWSIAGLQRIIENPDGSILLVDGNGSELLFREPTPGIFILGRSRTDRRPRDTMFRFDPKTGEHLEDFVLSVVEAGRNCLIDPYEIVMAPQGDLFVTTQGSNQAGTGCSGVNIGPRIMRFDGLTGQYRGNVFESDNDFAQQFGLAFGLAFGPDGFLYSTVGNTLNKFDPNRSQLVQSISFDGHGSFKGLDFSDDGTLFAIMHGAVGFNELVKVDLSTSPASLEVFAASRDFEFEDIAISPADLDGNQFIFVTNQDWRGEKQNQVLRFSLDGQQQDIFIEGSDHGIARPHGLAFTKPDESGLFQLYVSSCDGEILPDSPVQKIVDPCGENREAGSGNVVRFDLVNGEIVGSKEIVSKDSGGMRNPGRMVVVEGSNNRADQLISPTGDFSDLVRTDEGYERTLPDQTKFFFNTSGQLERIVDRNGNTTRYEYEGDNLRHIVDEFRVDGDAALAQVATTFNYTGDQVTSIDHPGNRTSILRYDGNQLEEIQDPDGSKREFRYDARGLLVQETNKRGHTEITRYDQFGRATEAVLADGSVRRFTTAQVRGLYPPELTSNPLTAPLAAAYGPATAEYIDENGNVARYVMDSAGQTVVAFDDVGPLPLVKRTPNNLVESVTSARGTTTQSNEFETRYSYDEQGNVTTVTDTIDHMVSSGIVFLTGDGRLNLLDENDRLLSGVQQGGFNALAHDGTRLIGYNAGQLRQLDPTQPDSVAKLFGSIDPAISASIKAATFHEGQLLLVEQALHVVNFDVDGIPSVERIGALIDSDGNSIASLGGLASSGGDFAFIGIRSVVEDPKNVSRFGTVDVSTGQVTNLFNVTLPDGTPVGTIEGLEWYKGQLYGFVSFEDENRSKTDRIVIIDTKDGHATIKHTLPSGLTFAGSVTVFSGAIQSEVEVEMEYDSTYNQLTKITDELGHETHFDIGEKGNIDSVRSVVGTLDEGVGGDDVVTSFEYYDSGLIRHITDPKGAQTEYHYYPDSGLVREIIFAKGDAHYEATQEFQYDQFGNLRFVTDERENVTEYRYDTHNRLEQILEPEFTGPDGERVQPVTIFDYYDAGNLESITDPQGNVTTNSYDERNRIIRTETDNGAVTFFTYDNLGNLIANVDPLFQISQFTYDARSRRISTIDDSGATTTFEYDLDNNLIELTDAAPIANTTRFAFDGRGRMVGETDPRGGTLAYTYDGADNLRTKVDRLGRVTEFEYDELDRLTDERWFAFDDDDELLNSNSISYDYDKNSNLEEVSDNYSKYDLRYDKRNRLEQSVASGRNEIVSYPEATLVYDYDAAGNVEQMMDTIDGVTVTTGYQYDEHNRVTQISQSGGDLQSKVVDYVYNKIGQYHDLTRTIDGQEVAKSSYRYDNLNRISSITHRNQITDAVIERYDVGYDRASRIDTFESIADGRARYDYDGRNQLTEATYESDPTRKEQYQYDPNGNREFSHLHGDGYDDGEANELTTDGTYHYEYDDEGNLIRRERIEEPDIGSYREFRWDNRNRLTSITDFDGDGQQLQYLSFAYDPFDRRISKTVTSNGASTTTYFVYDREDVIADAVVTGMARTNPVAAMRYLHGPGFDEVLMQEPVDADAQVLIADHLGSTRVVTDAIGAITSTIAYDAFGNLSGQPPLSSRYLFAGREFDAETGLYYSRARYLDTGLGQFITEDPLGLAAGNSDLYTYVANTPTNSTDPTGTIPIFVGAGLFGGTIGAVASAWTGGSIAQGFVEGFVAGAAASVLAPAIAWAAASGSTSTSVLVAAGVGFAEDSAVQGVSIALGFRCRYSLAEAGISSIFGGALGLFALVPERGLVNAADQALDQGVRGPESLAGFVIFGNKGLVGDSFARNIAVIDAVKQGASPLRGLANALEAEARAAGAKELRIIGHAILNDGFLNPRIADRFGFTFRRINDGTVELLKMLE